MKHTTGSEVPGKSRSGCRQHWTAFLLLMIRSQQIEQMEILAEQGWYGKKELETFIRTAREEGRLQALVWLMKEKNDRYGYEDREYDL